MPGSPAITIEGLSFSYGRTPVLEEVSLSVAEGDFVSVVGPNGGGKTTLLRLLLGLLEPSRGTVRIFGHRPAESRPRLGYMPQAARFDPLFPVSVMDLVLMGRLRQGRPLGPFRGPDRRAAERALEEVSLLDLRRQPLSSLSGGQQQRALIARALACQPDLLLLDEPTSSLDLRSEGELYTLLQELNRRMTVVVVSHDPAFVSGFVKTCICVNRRVFTHPTSELTGELIGRLYGGEVRLVRHDLRCPEEHAGG